MWKDEGDPGLGDECGSPGTDRSFIKGPWTTEEDQLLSAYVQKHGEGNWNAVQQNSGLSRCGKSCRLRWVNHLRADLKKGAFTEAEEQHVIRRHSQYGNKWARMAAELPGRTDNEIKNFWNTRLKRLQRLGLPTYPDGIRNQAMSAAQTGQNTDTSAANGQDQEDELKLPLLDFKHLQHNERLKLYEEQILTIPMPKFGVPTIIRPNVYIPTTPPNMEPGITFPVPGCIDMTEQNAQLWNYPSSYMSMQPSCSYRQGSPEQSSQVLTQRDHHFLGYDTYSSPSMSLNQEAEKLELPSIQRFDPQEVPDEWGIHPDQSMSIFDKMAPLEPIPTSESMLDFDESMPALESYDTLHQSSFADERPYDFDSGFYDGAFGLHTFESNGGKVANYTHSESPQIESFSLGDTKMANDTHFEYPQVPFSSRGDIQLAPVNVAATRTDFPYTGHNSDRMGTEPSSSTQSDYWDGLGSECSDERHVSEEDWFRRLVRRDR